MIPSFDPLEALERLQHNTVELARAHNGQSEIIQQLLNQNRQLNQLIARNRHELIVIQQRLMALEQQQHNEKTQSQNTQTVPKVD